MDETIYKVWWPLHLKRAQGKVLTSEEQAAYEAGRRELEAEEEIPGILEGLRQTRAEIQRLEEERIRLAEQRRIFQDRIALLEANLSDELKRALGVGV